MRKAGSALTSVVVLFSAVWPALASAPALRDDSRLQAKVTLQLKCEPLSSFAEIVAKATGVEVVVSKEIADRNLTAFATDMPASEAMAQVALVFDYKWEVKDDAPDYRYTLLIMKDHKTKAAQLRKDYYEKQDREFKEFIEDGIRVAQGDKSELQKVFDERPAVGAQYAMFKSDLVDLGCFTKQQRDDIWAKIAASPYGETKIPFLDLPEELQKRWRDRADASPTSGSLMRIDEKFLIVSRGGGYGSVRMKGIPPAQRLTFFGIGDSGGASGSAGLGVWPAGRALNDLFLRGLSEAGIDTSRYKASSLECVEPESKSKRVKLKLEGKKDGGGPDEFAEILNATAKTYKISLFADDYLCRYQNNRARRETLPSDTEEGLSELGRQFGYDLIESNGCYRLRNRTWYIDDAFEAPKRLVEHWETTIKEKNDIPDLNDYVEIAGSLNDFQLKGLTQLDFLRHETLERAAFGMGEYLGQLRLCASLTGKQMELAKEGRLTYFAMTPKQQKAFADLLYEARPELTGEQLWTCGFKVGKEHTEEHVVSHDDGFPDPGTSISNYITFTYIFGPEDERTFKLFTNGNFKRDAEAKTAK